MKVLLLVLAIFTLASAQKMPRLQRTTYTVTAEDVEPTGTFFNDITAIIADSTLKPDIKKKQIEAILANVTIKQTTPTILENDTIIEVTLSYKLSPVEGVRVCGKNVADWEFKPSRSDGNGVAQVKIITQGSRTIKGSYFMVVDLFKNDFFKENGILFETQRLTF